MTDRIPPKYQKLLDEGLITQQQVDAILQFEQDKPKPNWVLLGFILIGTLVIGLGIMAILASNWYYLSTEAKLGLDVILLIASGLPIIYAKRHQRPILCDALIFLFIIICLGTIGLVGELFNLPGSVWHAFVFWGLITLPVILLCSYVPVPAMWAGLVIINACTWLSVYLGIFKYHSSADEFALLSPWLALPFICGLLYQLLKLTPITQVLAHAFRFWIFWFGLFGVGAMDVILNLNHYFNPALINKSLFSVNFLIAIAVVCGIALSRCEKAEKLLLSSLIALYSLMLFCMLTMFNNPFLAAGLAIVILMNAAIYASYLQHKIAFYFLTILVAIRFLIVFFMTIGNMVWTGFGLIISGLLIIIVAVLWAKNIKRLQEWLTKFY